MRCGCCFRRCQPVERRVGLGGNLLHDHPLLAFGAGITVMNVCLALCLDWCVTFHEGRVGRVSEFQDR